MVRTPIRLILAHSGNASEYTAQTILAIMQMIVIIVGTVFTAMVLERMCHPDNVVPSVSLFVSDWGFVFLLVPVLWTIGTVILEMRDIEWSKSCTIFSGLIVLGVLFFFFVDSMFSPLFRGGV